MNPADIFMSFTFGNRCDSVPAAEGEYCPVHYAQQIVAGGPLEMKYLQNGTHPVSEWVAKAPADFHHYEVFYPTNMDSEMPVVVFCNGTGVKTSRYTAILRHLASWGFIAMGTEDEHSFSGFSAEMCLRYITRLNETPTLPDGTDNPFYGNVDVDHIGISGHSQGGVAVMNAVTETPHASHFHCAFAISPANKELSHDFMWDYDASKVHIPIMLLAGTGPMDSSVIVSKEQLTAIYDDMQSSPFRLMARKKDVDHGEMLYAADGYMTAFFMWQLKCDKEAAGAFAGDHPEIARNRFYQDIRIN